MRPPVPPVLITLLLLASALPARADTGPCRDDGREGLVCGQGAGAPRIIKGTVSPSGRLALAWRNPAAPPSDMPDGDVEDLLVRLADGAVLAAVPGSYWATGETRANRADETAVWSPDSRWLLKAVSSRFGFDSLEVLALGRGDAVRGRIDLRPRLLAALRKDLRRRSSDDPDGFTLMGRDEAPFRIDSRGRLTLPLVLWQPKEGPFFSYDVAVHVTARGGSLVAQVDELRLVRRDDDWPQPKRRSRR
jgi:hypothetical protein